MPIGTVLQSDAKDAILPHGGRLIDRTAEKVVAPDNRAEFARGARELPRVTLREREVSDLFLTAIGAFSPIEGFMTSRDYHAVVQDGRLASGLPWTIPITLSVSEEVARPIAIGQEVGLYSAAGRLLGTLKVEEKFAHPREEEARQVYLTNDASHPGVAWLEGTGEMLLGGPITLIESPPLDDVYRGHFLKPEETRALFRQLGWRSIVAFQTRNPVHRAHEYIQRCALETVDGLLLHPLVGETKSDDVPAPVRMRCYHALIDNYYPSNRVVLSVFPAAMRYAGPREAIFHAMVRKNFGCTHIIIGRDHAGVGSFYGPYDAHRIFERYTSEELGIRPVFFDFTFYCRRCQGIASEKTCRHDGSDRLSFSGTKVRELLRKGEPLPVEFTRPEIAAILAEAYGGR